MSNEEMKQALVDKLSAEQDTYRAWLLEQPPEEILKHTYEYTMREDIVFCAEELDLIDAQVAALLSSPSPMEDIYKEYDKRDNSYMEDIRDSIETRAEEVLSVWQSPLYTQSGAYASEHRELDAYRRSNKANLACKEAIHSAIRDSYHDNRLDTKEAVRQVVDAFGYDRTFYILALTVRHMDWDARFSRSNKEWAKTIPVPDDKDAWGDDRTTQYIVSQSHPGLVDLFINQARRDFLLTQPLTAEEIHAEAARLLDRLKQPQEPNSPSGTHFMAEVSADFMMRASTKDTEKLQKLLPFQSLSLSTLTDRKGIFAIISKEENRNQPLQMRKPSVRSKLQKTQETTSPKISAKSKGQER